VIRSGCAGRVYSECGNGYRVFALCRRFTRCGRNVLRPPSAQLFVNQRSEETSSSKSMLLIISAYFGNSIAYVPLHENGQFQLLDVDGQPVRVFIACNGLRVQGWRADSCSSKGISGEDEKYSRVAASTNGTQVEYSGLQQSTTCLTRSPVQLNKRWRQAHEPDAYLKGYLHNGVGVCLCSLKDGGYSAL
jgi:hypothetical protein